MTILQAPVPDFPLPRAMVADNDLALGQIVEAISKKQVLEKYGHIRYRR